MKRTTPAIAAAAALVLTACLGDDAGSSGIVSGDDVEVRMFDNRYEYTEVRIPVGGSVTWVGAGRNAHNAVDTASSWSTEGVFGSLEQYEDDEAVLTFDEPGEYTFFCTFHGNVEGAGMAGKLIVGESTGG